MKSREQSTLHVARAGSGGALPIGPIRPLGGRSRVEDGVHVADEEQPRPLPGDATHHDVPESRPIALRLVGDALHARAEATERIGDERGDLVHPVGGVRAAVHVHHSLQLGEVDGQAALDDAPQRG